MTAVTYTQNGIYWSTDEGAERQEAFVKQVEELHASGKTDLQIARELHTRCDIVRHILKG